MSISEKDLRDANDELKKAIIDGEYEQVWTKFQRVYKEYCEERNLPMLEDMNFILNSMLNVSVAT